MMDYLKRLSKESVEKFKEYNVRSSEELIDYIRLVEDRSVLLEEFMMEEAILEEIEQLPEYRSSPEERDLTQFGYKFKDKDDGLLYGKGEEESKKKS